MASTYGVVSNDLRQWNFAEGPSITDDCPNFLRANLHGRGEKKAVGRGVGASHCWDRVLLCCLATLIWNPAQFYRPCLPPTAVSATTAVRRSTV